MSDMRRREFITLLGGAAATWPLAARAQQAAMPVIGFLHIASPGAYVHVVAGLRRGLSEADFVEGRNVTVEYRWGEGELGRMPSLLADLLRNQVSVIVGSLQGAQAAKSAGVTIPVVFSTSDDPVKHGFVETLNRPGGNMTGVYLFTAELEGKRLGLLHDLLPKATIMAVLLDASHPVADAQSREVQAAAARLGVQLVVLHANSDQDFEAVFATLMKQKAEALLVCASPLFYSKRDQLVALAARHNRLGGHQHPYACRNGNHVVAFTMRSTVCNVTTSVPGGIRMVAPPITISIIGNPLGRAVGPAAHCRAASTITGANAEPFGPTPSSARRGAARRQPNSCCGVNPCRRATADTVSPLS